PLRPPGRGRGHRRDGCARGDAGRPCRAPGRARSARRGRSARRCATGDLDMMKILAVIAALAVTTSAAAVDIAGVQIADKANVGGQELVLNGAGLRKRAIFKVYVGSLYVTEKAATGEAVLAKGPRRIQMNVLRDLSADQLVNALVDGL